MSVPSPDLEIIITHLQESSWSEGSQVSIIAKKKKKVFFFLNIVREKIKIEESLLITGWYFRR